MLLFNVLKAFLSSKNHIKLLGRAGIRYRCGKRIMLIDSELLYGNDYGIIIFKDSIKRWEHPYEQELLTSESKLEILKILVDEFTDLGYKVIISD